MLNRIIEACINNRFMTLLLTAMVISTPPSMPFLTCRMCR
jgi:hypothetical protein